MYNNLIRIPVYVFEYIGYEFSVNNEVIFYNFFYIPGTLNHIQIRVVFLLLVRG